MVEGLIFWEWGCRRGGWVPLLDFVEAREKRNGDEDDDCFLAVANIDLCDR